MDTTAKLHLITKFCPFCAKSPRVHLGKTYYCQLHGEPYQDWYASCCVISMKADTKEEVIAKWNNRPLDVDLTSLRSENEVLRLYLHTAADLLSMANVGHNTVLKIRDLLSTTDKERGS